MWEYKCIKMRIKMLNDYMVFLSPTTPHEKHIHYLQHVKAACLQAALILSHNFLL